MLVDSHCHINFDVFDSDIDEVITRARENNIGILQLICTKFSELPKILSYSQKYDNIYASVGIHPCNVTDEESFTIEDLVNYAKNNPKIRAFGETGLDYYHQNNNKELQIECFKKHIEAARIMNLPVIIHARDADEDIIKVLEEEIEKGFFKILIHCFTATEALAQKVIAMGGYISISGIITFKNAIDLQNIVKNLPLDRLLVETDAPYLAPVPFRSKRNEPSYVKHTAIYLAKLLGVSYDLLEETTSNNYLKLFSIF